MDVRELWKRLNEGWVGVIFSVFLGIVFATFFYYVVLATVFQTTLPVVAVFSGSMDHDRNEFGYPCEKVVANYKESFNNWWDVCGGTYAQFDITKEKFSQFPFKDGFKTGDMPVVQGKADYKEGDIIVYRALTCDTRALVEKEPIIHRIVKIDERGVIHTKGDHNAGQNNLYENCIQKDQVFGKVIFIIPKLGYVKVLATKIVGL